MAGLTNSITTLARRTALAQLTAGLIDTVSPVAYMAFGDGGTDVDGEPVPPDVDQTELRHEVCRYPVERLEADEPTTTRYRVVMPPDEQAGQRFNEVALIDADGVADAIVTMYAKQKDAGVEFVFTFDDEF